MDRSWIGCPVSSGKWPLLELLRLGSFSILVCDHFLFLRALSDHLKQKHYQALASDQLRRERAAMAGGSMLCRNSIITTFRWWELDVSGCLFARGPIEERNFGRGNFSSADLGEAAFRKANLDDSDFLLGQSERRDLEWMRFGGFRLYWMPIWPERRWRKADLTKLMLARADLRGTALDNVTLNWRGIKTITSTQHFRDRNAPQGFVDWAKKMGRLKHRQRVAHRTRRSRTLPRRRAFSEMFCKVRSKTSDSPRNGGDLSAPFVE